MPTSLKIWSYAIVLRDMVARADSRVDVLADDCALSSVPSTFIPSISCIECCVGIPRFLIGESGTCPANKIV
jgi:hypothetical protein